MTVLAAAVDERAAPELRAAVGVLAQAVAASECSAPATVRSCSRMVTAALRSGVAARYERSASDAPDTLKRWRHARIARPQ